MKERKIALIIFIVICIIAIVFVLRELLLNKDKDKDKQSTRENFIGRYYRPVLRNFRKGFSSNVNHYMKNLSVSYKKFMY